jgi:hypothetical protein
MKQKELISILKISTDNELPYRAVLRLIEKGYLHTSPKGKRLYVDCKLMEKSVREFNEERHCELTTREWLHNRANWSRG